MKMKTVWQVRIGDDWKYAGINIKLDCITESNGPAVRRGSSGQYFEGANMDRNLNAGNWNAGNRNAGNLNTGDSNTGDSNTGDSNAGNRNAGNWNTGDSNTGNRNTGSWNAGSLNTGNWNTGSWNTGSWNAGNRNAGFFCVETPRPLFFDKPTNLTWEQAYKCIPYVDLPIGVGFVYASKMSEVEKAENPSYATFGGYLKKHTLPIRESFPIAWAKMTGDEKAKWWALPNFDVEKFLAITGVDVRIKPKMARVRMPDGTVAELEVVE